MAGGPEAAPEHGLRRTLTLWPLVFYGLSVIVGAGIYVAIGAVADRAGTAAPLAFLLAGVVAGCTGLCYAELAGRFPEAAGAAAYVRHASAPTACRSPPGWRWRCRSWWPPPRSPRVRCSTCGCWWTCRRRC